MRCIDRYADNKDFHKAYEDFRKKTTKMTGTNFGLLMSRVIDGKLVFEAHYRNNQPCQGGEMRKYKYHSWSKCPVKPKPSEVPYTVPKVPGNYLHGESCTRPDDQRPGDLRYPFPEGVVEAVSRNYDNTYSKSFPLFFNSNSPYRSAFGSEGSLDFVKDKSGNIQSVIFTDTEVDPTVLVNSLQFFNKADHQTIFKLLALGFTNQEALIIQYLNGDYQGDKPYINTTYSYYFSVEASLRKLFEGTPNDLTGGLYRDGFDYNRPDIQDLFKADPGTRSLNWFNEFSHRYKAKYNRDLVKVGTYSYTSNVTTDEFVDVTRSIFDDFYYNLERKEAA